MNTKKLQRHQVGVKLHPCEIGTPSNTPLNGTALFIIDKIKATDPSKIFWGKDVKDGRLVKNEARQYEFNLSHTDFPMGVLLLIIKKEELFFTPQKGIIKKLDSNCCCVPITYKTLAAMTDSELNTILNDLD